MLKQEKTKKKIITILGLMLVTIGIGCLTYDYLSAKKVMAYDTINNELFLKEPVETVDNNQTDLETVDNDASSDESVSDLAKRKSSYLGYLEIPKLSLKKGFLDIKDNDNTVEKNIMVVPTSNYPDKEKGNLIIAGHSGYGYKAFFQYLYQLDKGDQAYVFYGGKKYTYQITNIYIQEKTGKIAIYRDYEKKSLTLVTCTKDDQKTQTIYILECIKEENS